MPVHVSGESGYPRFSKHDNLHQIDLPSRERKSFPFRFPKCYGIRRNLRSSSPIASLKHAKSVNSV